MPKAIDNTSQQMRALLTSTGAFTICFMVWTIFSIIGIKIKQDLGLNETEFGLLIATPILTGSLSRLILGIWADQYGGRIVYTILMVVTAFTTWLLTHATTYPMLLLAALGVGLAGGGFAVGVAYVARWYPKKKQGTALGFFGVGNVGAAITNFVAPFLLVAFGWQGVANIYAAILLVTALLFLLLSKDDPVVVKQRETGERPRSALIQLEPLKKLQVWRFALYYFFVFGGFVALALWLPRYYVGAYGLDIKSAGMLSALYALPGSVFRAFGGWLSDKIGPRRVMYWTFGVSFICMFIMSYPSTEYIVRGINGPISFNITIGLIPFVCLTVVLGFFMSLGKAAVYTHIPRYYPEHVGSVGGMVGLVGGLGGFILPISFGLMNDLIGVWTSCFMLLCVLVGTAFIWMHFAIRRVEQKQYPQLVKDTYLPELANLVLLETKHMIPLESEQQNRNQAEVGEDGEFIVPWKPWPTAD